MAVKPEELRSRSWRLSHLYKIVNKSGQLVRFIPNAAQADFQKNAHTRNIILKSRQLGFTSLEAIESLDDTLWTEGFSALMLSYDKDSSLDIFDRKIALAWEHYPEKLKQLYVVDTERSNKLKFDFGKGIYSEILVRTRGRSGTYHRVHISEFAKICQDSVKKEREVLTGTIPSVPASGRLDIESTAEGEDGAFHDMFMEAWTRGEARSPLEFKAHFYNWQWDKEEISKIPVINVPNEFEVYRTKYNLSAAEISYYYQKYLSLGSSWPRLKQEYPTTVDEAFTYSGVHLFDVDKLKLQEKYIKTGEKVGDWIYYEGYIPSHWYALGADVAEGVGCDSSVAIIVDFAVNPARVVAEYVSDRIEPDMFAFEIKNGANRYGACMAAPERNNHGWATITKLKEIYVNIFEERDDYGKLRGKFGWHTTALSKPKMLYALNDAINEGLIAVPSKAILNELRTYDKRDVGITRYDEEATRHWDRVMALAIVWQMKAYVQSSTFIPLAEPLHFETDKFGRQRIIKKDLISF